MSSHISNFLLSNTLLKTRNASIIVQNSTNATSTSGWIQSPDGRGTLDIIWSCLFTVFICTWTVLHLNVPAPDEKLWRIQVRKTKWMLMSIVFPEALTAKAFVQYISAKQSVERMAKSDLAWTMRQAFFLNMGSVWLRLRDGQSFPLNAKQLEFLVAKGILHGCPLSEEEVWDKSKADSFAKAFACIQIGWLALQCIGRAASHLPITPLEIGTLGFSIPSLATFCLWFNKPSNVEVPFFIQLDKSTDELLDHLSCPENYVWDQTPLDFIDTVNKPSFTSEVILKSAGWPGRHAFEGPSRRIRNDIFALKYSKLHQVFVVTVWIGYGGMHFFPWDYDFPTRVELLLWRIACIIMAGTMVLGWVAGNRKCYLLLTYLIPTKFIKEKMRGVAYEQKRVSPVQLMLGALVGLIYMAARLIQIAEVFASLRAAPQAVFSTVQWTNILPHI